ncbi:MAG TPA: AAA family ATPase, partial [Acidimicrobiales bacterium]|nr:AAA family ATPase [Acidimicrobiales bacterium]
MSDSAVRAPATEPSFLSDAPMGLPRGLPDFVGRLQEIADLRNRIAASRLVTLTGAPGIGKTRLALEVATRLDRNYPDGAWFIDLAPVTDPALVAQAVSSTLGFEAEPGREPLDVLCRRLHPLTMLLVLDNCEHVLEAATTLVERVTSDCARISLLATSQQRLGIGDEDVVPVDALSLPELNPSLSIAFALESEAIVLFCARAAARQSGFRLTDEGLPSIVDICRRLDGIPLAIELAATRIAVLGPAEIAERLEQRLPTLTEPSPGAPARHQTLTAALDWSHGLLADDEAALFRRMSVFAGGATLEAVEDVCGGKGAPRDDIVDLLAALVAKSLVVADTNGVRARYRMLATVRAYAGE